jgi:AcrR family transcriptional regulator
MAAVPEIAETVVASRREAIVMAAKQAFLERGFTGATMDEIAARAGTTKRTVYNHFRNKEALFVGIVELASQLFLQKLEPPDPAETDVVQALEDYLARFCELTTWRDAVALQRLMLAAAGDFPEHTAALCRTVLDEAEARLAGYLETRGGAAGLAIADGRAAAAQLLDLATAGTRVRTLFGVTPPLGGPPEPETSPAVDRAPIRAAVNLFLRAHRTAP